MKINARYFASLRERLGIGGEELTLPDGASVQDVLNLVRENGGGDGALGAAVNLEFAKPEDKLKDGDEVAVFPPVTGG